MHGWAKAVDALSGPGGIRAGPVKRAEMAGGTDAQAYGRDALGL